MREHILNEIRRLERESGQPPGVLIFERETGISRRQWLGKFWARWGDALSEAGLDSNEFTQPLNRNSVLLDIIAACRHYGKIPTQPELDLFRKNNRGLPSGKTIARHFGSRAGLLNALAQYSAGNESYADITAMLPQGFQVKAKEKPSGYKIPEGFIYLIKSGDFYKVGRSDDLERRVKEIRIALPDKAVLAHTIRTDDPAGIEAYWHRRFAEKRSNGEWFKLTPLDVAAFKKRKFQ